MIDGMNVQRLNVIPDGGVGPGPAAAIAEPGDREVRDHSDPLPIPRDAAAIPCYGGCQHG